MLASFFAGKFHMPLLFKKKTLDLRPLSLITMALLFVAFTLWSQSDSWSTLLSSTEVRLVETAHSIATHTDDVYALAKMPLEELVVGAEKSLSDGTGMVAVVEEMHRIATSTSLFRSVAYADASGKLIESTLNTNSAGTDVAYREYFQFHQFNPDRNARLGLPSKSQSDGRWFLPITQRIDRPDGSFGGVMVATIDLDHFFSFMQGFNLGDDSSFALMRGDGKIIVRLPVDPNAMGASIASTPFYREHSSKEEQGVYRYVSPFDGTDRIGGFYKSKQTGVTVLAARSKSVLFKSWVRYSQYPWLCLLLTALAATAIAIRWLRQRRQSEIVEQKIAAREAEFRVIADASADVIQKIDMNGSRQYVSRAAEKVFGQHPQDLIGSSIYNLADAEEAKVWQDALAKLHEGMSNQTVLSSRRRPDEDVIWLESVISSVPLSTGGMSDGYVVVTRDVTQQEVAKRELGVLAITDELTGLFNKRYFASALKKLSNKRQNRMNSLIMIDLDLFKKFNDTYGHLQGDKCLRDVAATIREILVGRDAIAARVGGEEIAVLMPGADAEDAGRIAENIRQGILALKIPHEPNAPYGYVTVSLGHATALRWRAGSEDEVMVAADQALYEAKRTGRNKSVASFGPVEPKIPAMTNSLAAAP